jgi:hypothetical protein
MSKVSAPEIVRGLVARFDRNRDSYLAGGINETQLRCGQSAIERQIAATDKQIDALVCELHGLTEEEIKIVEGGLR